MLGASGHVLHVVGSVALTELRDAQVLGGVLHLRDRQVRQDERQTTQSRLSVLHLDRQT